MPAPRLLIVDAFSASAFSGNPAAVCLLQSAEQAVGADAWMQHLAAEMNLSETAFVWPAAVAAVDYSPEFHLRWFTPTVEVDLCGHATLAAAHTLWEQGDLPAGAPARFRTRSGLLGAERSAADGSVELDFPADPATPLEGDEADALMTQLAGALGCARGAVLSAGRNSCDVLAELADEATLRSLAPDMARLATIPCRGVIVTAPPGAPSPSPSGTHFVSRFFGPRAGISEDPVTGSAHTCLGPFWAARLGVTGSEAELRGYQASARGGTVTVRLVGGREKLKGSATTVLVGAVAPGALPRRG